MPRQERNKKAATKALAEAAAKPGQLRLTSLFDVQREAQPSTNTSNETTVTTIVEQGSQEQRDEIVHMQIPWVKNADDFTNVDKEKSERSGRYFQREWFQKFEWLIYNRETNRAFCKTCATYHNDEALKGVFGNYEVGFGNWKKGTEKFKEHEESHAHKIASAIMGQQPISSLCSSQSLATQQLPREALISHFHTFHSSPGRPN